MTLSEMIDLAKEREEKRRFAYRKYGDFSVPNDPVVCGRVSVRASPPPQGKFNQRLNFKVDGKRATEAQAMAALGEKTCGTT